MLADPGAVLGEQRQRLFVGLTQFRAVFNRIQMADRREDASQHIVHFRQRLAKIFPAIRRAVRHRAFHRGPAILQRFGDRRDHVLWFDRRKRRQGERRQ
ncbi:Uncharacterised protein [Klebsiella pneumoniae]|nr:Uncharacterised protein [Klebsiella pneumoniae]